MVENGNVTYLLRKQEDDNRCCWFGLSEWALTPLKYGAWLMPIRILIADDDPAIRRLFRRLLEAHPDWQVCGEAVNGVDAIEKVALIAPDLAILDLGMPLKNGIEAARAISQFNPSLPLLLISVQEMSDQLVEAARQAGFRGGITKSRGTEVVKGVEAVLHNQLFFERDNWTPAK